MTDYENQTTPYITKVCKSERVQTCEGGNSSRNECLLHEFLTLMQIRPHLIPKRCIIHCKCKGVKDLKFLCCQILKALSYLKKATAGEAKRLNKVIQRLVCWKSYFTISSNSWSGSMKKSFTGFLFILTWAFPGEVTQLGNSFPNTKNCHQHCEWVSLLRWTRAWQSICNPCTYTTAIF